MTAPATCPWHCHNGWLRKAGDLVPCTWCKTRNGDPLEANKPRPRRNDRVTAIIAEAHANARRAIRAAEPEDGAA